MDVDDGEAGGDAQLANQDHGRDQEGQRGEGRQGDDQEQREAATEKNVNK